jgi:hypothetical protein
MGSAALLPARSPGFALGAITPRNPAFSFDAPPAQVFRRTKMSRLTTSAQYSPRTMVQVSDVVDPVFYLAADGPVSGEIFHVDRAAHL